MLERRVIQTQTVIDKYDIDIEVYYNVVGVSK